MTKVTIDVPPGRRAYYLVYRLADIASDIEIRAMRWKDKDEVWEGLKAEAEFYKGLAKQLAKQVSTNDKDTPQ